MRLQRFLSQAGVASRRHAEKLIVDGRVKVNGRVVTELGTKVEPGEDTVEVDGKRALAEDNVYVLLNKPKGTVTTVSDPEGRKTVMELLPPLPAHVVPVGRLDFYTEGVLLLTNDGELQAALLAPRSKVDKTYHAKVRGKIDPEDIAKLRSGVRLPRDEGGRRTAPAQVDILKFTGTHTWLVITISEGRSRQIHRMLEALGYQVLKLARVSFAGLTYYGLKIGQSRRLTDAEVKSLRQQVGLAPLADNPIPAPSSREDARTRRTAPPVPGGMRRRPRAGGARRTSGTSRPPRRRGS